MNQSDTSLDKILDDAYRMGKTDATLPSAHDYDILMPKMKAKLKTEVKKATDKARVDELKKLIEGKPLTGSNPSISILSVYQRISALTQKEKT